MRASDTKLTAALRAAGLTEMAERAAQGHYNEFFGPLATPELTLAAELAQVGTVAALAVRVRLIDGEFDAGIEESEEWGSSPAGQAAFGRLVNSARKR